ncbi:mitochondrial cardiolipin hydrolase zuc isoform X2 [Colletes latitarsis]|uniref:mitochondrial cardiolipin hydrolase zuc isoform X2 n=1 Tax=Colletes latitarsis TaxID=2605962 RepID=UPI00403567AE
MINNKIFLVGGILITSEIIWKLYKRFRDSRKNVIDNCAITKTSVDDTKRNISEVMFFSKASNYCRVHANSGKACSKDNCPVRYMRNLENYMNCAKQSLDVCMHMLTCQMLSKAIVNARKRGVLVRVIMDRGKAVNDAAQTVLFHSNGITIKMQDSDVLMHHKFVIVDRDIVITGSTNWTMSAFFGNFENVLVTNHNSLVEPFVQEFEKLWMLFEHPLSPKTDENLQQLILKAFDI